jgi:hypothetical protein
LSRRKSFFRSIFLLPPPEGFFAAFSQSPIFVLYSLLNHHGLLS